MDTETLAKAMLKMMLDDDYFSVLESELISFVKSNTGEAPDPEQLTKAAEYINSLFPDRKPIVTIEPHEDEQLFQSPYSENSLALILDKIEHGD